MQWFMLSPWFKHLCCCRVIACLLIGLGSLGLTAQPSPEISAVSSLSSSATTLATTSATNSPIAEAIVLDSNAYHLGVDGLPEWRSFEGRHPHGRELHLALRGLTPTGASTLIIRQEDVKEGWEVRFNQRKLGQLATIEQAQITVFEIPGDWVREDANQLAILAPKAIDDIVVGPIQWVNAPTQAYLQQGSVHLTARDRATGQAMPARFTLTDASGALVPMGAAPGQHLAMRPGVAYTGNGQAQLSIPPGTYRLYASRGFEYGVARELITVRAGEPLSVDLALEREVDTTGWVAADTHIHTRTFSGHGDATLEETMLSIAGEGIELAVATDHNHHTDYRGSARAMGVANTFTPVIGNEVTTAIGHFNAFPIDPDASPPDHTLKDWANLIQAMRRVSGVRAIVLNHPRNIHGGFSPMAPEWFDSRTGEHAWAAAMSFDGMEVVTSAALQSDPMLLFRDWFALLNQGHRLVGLGSSDTHDIHRYILGQGRTYLRCKDHDPSAIDIEAACQALLEGRALISMGLWVNMVVNPDYGVGDHVPSSKDPLKVRVDVAGPSWTEAQVVELYQDGQRIRSTRLGQTTQAGIKAQVRWTLRAPQKNAYLVAVARGPAVAEPFWVIPRPYQHTSLDYQAMVIGATNPIWLDGSTPAEPAR